MAPGRQGERHGDPIMVTYMTRSDSNPAYTRRRAFDARPRCHCQWRFQPASADDSSCPAVWVIYPAAVRTLLASAGGSGFHRGFPADGRNIRRIGVRQHTRVGLLHRRRRRVIHGHGGRHRRGVASCLSAAVHALCQGGVASAATPPVAVDAVGDPCADRAPTFTCVTAVIGIVWSGSGRDPL